jgi:hypothetical protein
MPERIRLSRAKGFRLPDGAINVARPGPWGNLWIVGRHGTRLQCACRYAALAGGFISFSEADIDSDAQMALWERLDRRIGELRGHDLACWCALDGGACHADVLLYLANSEMPRPSWMAGEIDLGRPRIGMAARDFDKLRKRGTAA